MKLQLAWSVSAAAVVVILLPAAALAQTLPCVARAELEPASAVVGQQVLWKVQIDSRDDVAEISWVDMPAFANFRTEGLPGLPMVPRAETGVSTRYTTREERRALYAERAGALRIATSGLHCKLKNGVVLATPVPPVTLTVVETPSTGRPDDFTGVVGPLVLQTHVDPDSIALGETLHVTVSIRGTGNLWDVEDLLRQWNPVDTDVFAQKPSLELRVGDRLSVQRIFRYDVVPRSVGRFAVPPIRLSYFDAVAARYSVARSSGSEVTVLPRKTSTDRVDERDFARPVADQPASGGATSASPVFSLASVITAVIVLSLALSLGYWLWQREIRHRVVAAPVATGDPDRDAAELVRALKSALASFESSSGTSLGNGPEHVAQAVDVLEALERSRFDPKTVPPERDVIERALAQLRRRR